MPRVAGASGNGASPEISSSSLPRVSGNQMAMMPIVMNVLERSGPEAPRARPCLRRLRFSCSRRSRRVVTLTMPL